MNLEIKNRLAQIRAGEIPKGYKKCTLGIVPEDWKEINFSDLFTSTSDYTDDLEKYPLYSLTIEDGITAKTDRYNRSHLVKKENSYKILQHNDFAYNPMNIRFGAVARHKGDTPVAVSGYYDIFTTVHPGDLTFMDNFLTCGAMITYYNRVSTGSLVEKQRVHFSDFLKFSLPLPPLAERERIAKILSSQDKVIELCERKLEQLKRMKKYYLQNMFPKDGEEYPEIRFKGFTEPWEQRKVSSLITDIADGPFGSNLKTEHYTDEKEARIIQLSNLSDNGWQEENTRYTTFEHANEIKRCIVNEGELVMGKMMPAGMTIIRPNTEKMYVLSSDCVRIKLDNNIAINKFFLYTDTLITLHQRKCEEEKKKKKALQQLLLTGLVRV